MNLIEPGQAGLRASMELIDPLEQPGAYGNHELLTDLLNVSGLESEAPPLTADLVRALRYGDSADVVIPGPLKAWARRPDRYRVLRDGRETASVPFLAASAPDVADVEVSAAQSVATSDGGEMSLKIAGTGLGASAKLTIASGYKIACGRRESQVAYVSVPIVWELRAAMDNDDYNWMHTELALPPDDPSISVVQGGVPPEVRVLSHARINAQLGGSKPTEVTKAYAIEAGVSFTLGIKIDAIGLDATLKVSTEQALDVELDAALPSKYTYDVAWLGGPWGVAVTV